MKKNKAPTIVVEKVPEDKSKIKFEITFRGEWDWNRDFASEGRNETFDGPSPVTSMIKPHFEQAFIDMIANDVFVRFAYFDTVTKSNVKISAEVSDAYHVAKGTFEKTTLSLKKAKLWQMKEDIKNLEKELSGK